jgi:hypothetical protein
MGLRTTRSGVLAVCTAANRDLDGIGRNRSEKSERGLYGPWESLERGSCGKIPLSTLSMLTYSERRSQTLWLKL